MKKIAGLIMALGMSIALFAPLSSVNVSASEQSTQDSAGVTFTGELPEKEAPGVLQQLDTKVVGRGGDVQTGVTMPTTVRNNALLASVGAFLVVLAGYLTGIRLKVYREE